MKAYSWFIKAIPVRARNGILLFGSFSAWVEVLKDKIENISWHTYLRKPFLLQKSIVRIITNSAYQSHREPFKSAQCLRNFYYFVSFQQQKKKKQQQQLPTAFNDMFKQNKQFHDHFTRQSNKFYTVLKKPRLGQFSISYTGPKVWDNFSNIANEINSCLYTIRRF